MLLSFSQVAVSFDAYKFRVDFWKVIGYSE